MDTEALELRLPAFKRTVLTAIPFFGDVEKKRVFDLATSTEIIKKLGERTAIACALTGLELWWVKLNLRHGKWTPWIKKQVGYSVGTVQAFMRAGRAIMSRCSIEFGSKPTSEQLHQAWKEMRSNHALTQGFEFDVWRNRKIRDMATVPIEKRAIAQVNVYDKVVLFARNNWLKMSQEERKTMLETIDFWIDELMNLPNELEELGQQQLSEAVREAIQEWVIGAKKRRAELDEERCRELDELLERKVQLTMELERINKQCERLKKHAKLACHA